MPATVFNKKRIHRWLGISMLVLMASPVCAKDLVLSAYQISYELNQRSFTTTLVVNQKIQGRKGAYRGYEYDTKQPFFATVTGSQLCAVPRSTGVQSFSYCFSWSAQRTSTAQALVVTCTGGISLTETAKCFGEAYPASVRRVELEGLPNP